MNTSKLESALQSIKEFLDDHIRHLSIDEVLEVAKLRNSIQEFVDFIENDNNDDDNKAA